MRENCIHIRVHYRGNSPPHPHPTYNMPMSMKHMEAFEKKGKIKMKTHADIMEKREEIT